MQMGFTPPAALKGVTSRALIAGVVFSVILIVGAFINRAQFFHAYLVGYTFWIGITVGSLALLMLQHLTGGAWGVVIRRVLEAATRTLPLMVLLFIPIVLGLSLIYPWMHVTAQTERAGAVRRCSVFLTAMSCSTTARPWRPTKPTCVNRSSIRRQR